MHKEYENKVLFIYYIIANENDINEIFLFKPPKIKITDILNYYSI